MTDLEAYTVLLEAYFGAGSARFNAQAKATNHVVGAINHSQFDPFREAFKNRLRRLAIRYPATDPNRPKLLERLNEIANEKNWAGAYAEIVALDFLNSNTDYLPGIIELSKKGLASETLTGAMNGKESDHDGYYTEANVLFDVKVLSDKSKAQLDSVIKEATRELSMPPQIVAEYPLDADFKDFQTSRAKLVRELKTAVSGGNNPTSVNSQVVPNLTFKVYWSGRLQSSVHSYNAYQHALNHHTLLFSHAKKFSRVSPNLIVFVVFPWFSEKPLMVFDDSLFYRSFARRFFCQYKNDSQLAKTFPLLDSFQGPETVSQITSKLSGVLFVEDLAIMTKSPDDINARGLAFLNPNAEHKVGKHFEYHLKSLQIPIDDFEHDNY